MITVSMPSALQRVLEDLRKKGRTVGFVPTMGALHEGHLELIRQSKKDNAVTVVSIFVNPTQFGPREDFKRYPRPIRRDKKLLSKAGVDYLLYPSAEAMYPKGDAVYVDLHASGERPAVTELYCGRSRPGHFRGVLTVCAKLFNIVRPHRVYMGAKDYQQTVVIQRLIEEMQLGIRMIRVPTVREADGLALSSRNIYLSADERVRALSISKTLQEARRSILSGQDLKKVLRGARLKLARFVDRIDYLEAADPVSLEPLQVNQKDIVLLAACYVGKTRLIDNVTIQTR